VTKPPFYVDEQGSIVGPGMLIPKEDQHQAFPGMLVVSVERLNQLYMLGVAAGRLEVAEAQRKMRERTYTEKILLDLEDPDYPDIPPR
jgi:hypothetical protein